MTEEIGQNPRQSRAGSGIAALPHVGDMQGQCRARAPRRFFRGRLALILALGVPIVPTGFGQEPDARPSSERPRGRAGDASAPAAGRRIPDALRFAHGLLRQRKFDLAAEEYERFLADRPSAADRLDALFGLANARLDQGRYPESLRAFRQ